jgi:hypothetical protein
MEPKLTLRQIDCASSKEGGLLLSLHLLPTGAAGTRPEGAPKRIRRRRKRSFTNEQMLEIARTAIDEAVSDQSELARKAVNRPTSGAASASPQRTPVFRVPRRPPWPG